MHILFFLLACLIAMLYIAICGIQNVGDGPDWEARDNQLWSIFKRLVIFTVVGTIFTIIFFGAK